MCHSRRGASIQRIDDNKQARKEESIEGLGTSDGRLWKVGSRKVVKVVIVISSGIAGAEESGWVANVTPLPVVGGIRWGL
jgi:hypothetical protein